MLSAELFTRHGLRACDKTVAKLLRAHGYSLQAPTSPWRHAASRSQCAVRVHQRHGGGLRRPRRAVISVDTKKKELIANFKNGGREWHP